MVDKSFIQRRLATDAQRKSENHHPERSYKHHFGYYLVTGLNQCRNLLIENDV